MCPTRGFYTNKAGWQPGDKREDLLSRQSLLYDDVPLGIDAMKACAILCDIDAECCHLCHDGLSCC
jgi:hypothetical protein